MGEIADWILEGGLCSGCGEYMGDSPGFSQHCAACKPEDQLPSFRKQRKQAMHRCHADDCETQVPPKLFMCGKHWKMVSRPTQRLIWKYYSQGQERRKDPSKEYIAAATQAKAEVRSALAVIV